MIDLLGYQGNAGLGIGSTPGASAPLGPNDNLKTIDAIGRDVMLLDADRNTKIFQQKIADRDSLAQLILKNQVSVGEIDPKYHGEFDKAQGDVEKAYDEWGGHYNDMDGYRKYQAAVTHLQDVATHAQVNTVEMKKLIEQRSKETLPWKQKALDQWIGDQQKKSFWDHVDPYQQQFSFSVDPIKKLYAQTSTSVLSPDRLWKYDITHADFAGTLKNAQSEYLNQGETAEDMREFLSQVDDYNPIEKEKFVTAINGQLQKYNSELGLSPGQPGYAEPIKLVIGPDNNTHVMASPVDFAAKYALSQQERFAVQGPGQFQKDLGTFELGKEKNEIAWEKLKKVDQPKAEAYVAEMKAKTDKFLKDNKDESTRVESEYQDFVDNMKPGGITLTDKKTKKQTGRLDAVFLDELPEGYQYINGPVAAVKETKDKKGNITSVTPTGKITVGKLEPFKSSEGRPYYIPHYTNSQTGEKITLDSDELKGWYKQSKAAGFPGSYDEYIRTLLKKGSLSMTLQGQNGTANYTSMFQSAKTINNEGSKKGQENIENPPEDDGEDQ